MNDHRALRLGIGGPVGSGKTALVDALCKRMRDEFEIAVVTNDIYTKEDAMFLVRSKSLDEERIVGVETGGCPHTAIREDASMNLTAIDELHRRFDNLDIVIVESGGDNLSATFSPELCDLDVVCNRRIGRRQDSSKRWPGNYKIRPADHQQNRSCTLRRSFTRSNAPRCNTDERRTSIRILEFERRQGSRGNCGIRRTRRAAAKLIEKRLARINHQFGNWAPYCLEISLQYCLWPVQSMIRHFSAQLKHKVSNLVVFEQLLALVRHYRTDFDALATPGACVKTGHWMF